MEEFLLYLMAWRVNIYMSFEASTDSMAVSQKNPEKAYQFKG